MSPTRRAASVAAMTLLSTLPFDVAAQVDSSSPAYQAGHSAGRIVIAVVVVAVVRKFLKK